MKRLSEKRRDGTALLTKFLFTLLLLACHHGAWAQKEPFWFGVDMGWLTQYEAGGWKCHDTEGKEWETMELMGSYGVNAQRMRVWVDPSKHGGWCGKEDVLQKCLRAKALGQEIMIDFHYSDWWADPAKQNIPASWRGHSYEQMKKDLSRHTIDVLTLLKRNGITPKWVQVGNETRNGMLWNVKIDPRTGWEWKDEKGNTVVTESMGHAVRNPEQYAGFFKAGYEAVKKVFPKAIVIVHLDNGYDNDMFNWNLDILRRNGAKFDMIGMSLYPYWSMESGKEPSAEKTIEDGIRNINLLAKKYGCDVMITETGFEVDERHPEKMQQGYEQLTMLIRRSLEETDGHCRGIFYWEPECRPGQYKLGAFDSKGAPTVIMNAYREQSQRLRGVQTINVIGDSYVANHRRDKSETWHYRLAQQLGMTYNNYGRNGACVAFDRTHDGRFNFGPALYQKASSMDASADYVIIIGGHNDAEKVGMRRDSLAMFRDSLQLLIDNIRLQCPKARIGYVTPWYVDRPGFKQVCKTIRQVCRKNKIPVLDNYSQDCIIQVRDDKFRQTYFQAPGDHAHLNAEGHRLFLEVAMKWFKDFVESEK